MPLNPVSLPTVQPQAGPVAPANTFAQSFPDPSAGVDMSGLASAFGIASANADKAQVKKDQEYESNADYYAQTFMHDHQNGLVNATQVGAAMPGASPIVAGHVTQLIGANWGTQYANEQMNGFLQSPDALDPVKQDAFYKQLQGDIAGKVAGNPFYGAGAIKAAQSVIDQHRSNLEAQSQAGYQATLETAYGQSAVAAARGQPVVTAPATPSMSSTPGSAPTPVPLAPPPTGTAVDAINKAAPLPAGSPTALLSLIAAHESDNNYNAYIGHSQNTPAQLNVTGMTLDQVLQWQRSAIASGKYPSTAIGKYQIIMPTMQGLIKTMGLSGDTVYSPELQDQMAMQLLKERGYDQFKAGTMSAGTFQDNIAKEWASMPTSAGNGYYAGQTPTASGSDLLVAMSNTAAQPNPVAAVDSQFGATSSIAPQRRTAIAVDAIIADAKARGDATSLDNIPTYMSSIPAQADKIMMAKKEIARGQIDDLRNAHEAAAYADAQKLQDNQAQILADNVAGKDVNPNQYTDAASHAFAIQIRAEGRNDPTQSAVAAANLEQKLLGYGTLAPNWWDATNGANKPAQMTQMINSNPDLTPTDKQQMLAKVPTYAAGVNLISDPQVSDSYNRMAGADLNAYLHTITGKLGKMFGSDPIATLRDRFDGHLRDEVTAYIQDHGVPPTGSAKLAMVRSAGAEAQKYLASLVANPDGVAASAAPGAVQGTPAADQGTSAKPPPVVKPVGPIDNSGINMIAPNMENIGAMVDRQFAPKAALQITKSELLAKKTAGTISDEERLTLFNMK
jgi:hypothetical protein